MSNYRDSKAKLDKISREYTCKGGIIFTTAMQMVVEHGTSNFNDDEWFNNVINGIDQRHDKAEAEGKILWVTRDFEKAIVNCARAVSEITPYDLMVYIQREMYLSNGLMDGEPTYQRAIEIIKGILGTEEYYCEYCAGGESFADKIEEYGLTEDEICYFGYEKYVYEEEEE